MRYSPQRETIKNIVYSTNSHPTADWIFCKAKIKHPSISLGTVYRNLNQLTENGLICQIKDGKLTRFDWNTSHHDHLKCKACGDLIDIQLSNVCLTKTIKKEFDFKVSDVEITILGKCNKHN
tara:strand:+ start:2554 stop:2919 length:366 start_codon:yes stop_codon:yes gene_type:complete